jgi:hypothetical protein
MNELTTLSHKLRIARNEANEDSTLLDLTAKGDAANRPSVLDDTVGVIDLLKDEVESVTWMKVNGIEFYFCGGTAADKTFGWRLLAWRPTGPARLAAVGTGTLGTQAMITYPHNGLAATNKFWADTLTVTWENWPKQVETTDITGHNTVASIWLDTCGHRYFKIEITDADGSTGTEAGSVSSYWGYW